MNPKYIDKVFDFVSNQNRTQKFTRRPVTVIAHSDLIFVVVDEFGNQFAAFHDELHHYEPFSKEFSEFKKSKAYDGFTTLKDFRNIMQGRIDNYSDRQNHLSFEVQNAS